MKHDRTMRIDWSGMCCRKPIKLGFYIKFMNFLMMNMRLIKCEHISLRMYMYCKHWCSCQDRINGENSHQSLASIVRNACWVLYFESDTKIQKIPSKKLSKKDWTTGWIPVFSSREHHFEIRRVGHDCRPCRFKFNISRCVKARDCPWS